MADSTNPSSAQDMNLDVIALYDSLMSEIEPELMSTVIPALAEIYRDETPEEKKKRGERYAKAFEEVMTRFSELIQASKTEALAIRDELFKNLHLESDKEDTQKMADLDSSIQAA